MATGAVFESVWDRPVSELDGPGAIDRLQMLEQQHRLIECEMVELIGEVDRRELYREDQHASVKGWCRAGTRWSEGDARARARSARLAEAFSAVAGAMTDGLLGVAQSREIARAYSNPRVRDQLGDVIEIHQHGGHTSTSNGGPMCRFHNIRKRCGFSVWRDPGGHWHTFRPDGTEIR